MEEEGSILILNFLLRGERFGLKVSDTLEVNRLPEMFPVHGTDKSVVGLINLHGKSIPLIALDRLLMSKSEGKKHELFIALNTKKGPLCLLVDELIGFEKIPKKDVKKPEDMSFKFDIHYFQFVCLKPGTIIPVLDVNFLTKITE